MVLDAICLLFGLEESWEISKRNLLGDMKFLDKLVIYINFLNLRLNLIWKKLQKVDFSNYVINIYRIKSLIKIILLNNQKQQEVYINGLLLLIFIKK